MENMDQNQHKHQKPQYRNEASISASSWVTFKCFSTRKMFLSTDFYFVLSFHIQNDICILHIAWKDKMFYVFYVLFTFMDLKSLKRIWKNILHFNKHIKMTILCFSNINWNILEFFWWKDITNRQDDSSTDEYNRSHTHKLTTHRKCKSINGCVVRPMVWPTHDTSWHRDLWLWRKETRHTSSASSVLCYSFDLQGLVTTNLQDDIIYDLFITVQCYFTLYLCCL